MSYILVVPLTNTASCRGGFGSSFNTKGPIVPAPNTSTFLGNAYPQPDQNLFGTQLPPSQNFVGMQSFNGFGNTNSGIAGTFLFSVLHKEFL